MNRWLRESQLTVRPLHHSSAHYIVSLNNNFFIQKLLSLIFKYLITFDFYRVCSSYGSDEIYYSTRSTLYSVQFTYDVYVLHQTYNNTTNKRRIWDRPLKLQYTVRATLPDVMILQVLWKSYSSTPLGCHLSVTSVYITPSRYLHSNHIIWHCCDSFRITSLFENIPPPPLQVGRFIRYATCTVHIQYLQYMKPVIETWSKNHLKKSLAGIAQGLYGQR